MLVLLGKTHVEFLSKKNKSSKEEEGKEGGVG